MVSAENWREPGEVEAAADSAEYWRAAYEQYGPALLAYLLSRLPRRDDAEDLLQETFVRAIRASGSLRDEGKLRSYLFTVAHNLMINQVRRTRVLPLSSTGERRGDTFEGIADDESDSP
ncbi:MAG TPA: sigma-70 family RNA polymerase sigma factor, partial [Bacteroidetes bacterium]|nr:sigma-70 family RNA polymerase sigma factor [Bacteroidota bacterium]